MTDEEIFAKIKEISKHYNEDEWSLYDLQCDLEEVFDAVEERKK